MHHIKMLPKITHVSFFNMEFQQSSSSKQEERRQVDQNLQQPSSRQVKPKQEYHSTIPQLHNTPPPPPPYNIFTQFYPQQQPQSEYPIHSPIFSQPMFNQPVNTSHVYQPFMPNYGHSQQSPYPYSAYIQPNPPHHYAPQLNQNINRQRRNSKGKKGHHQTFDIDKKYPQIKQFVDTLERQSQQKIKKQTAVQVILKMKGIGSSQDDKTAILRSLNFKIQQKFDEYSRGTPQQKDFRNIKCNKPSLLNLSKQVNVSQQIVEVSQHIVEQEQNNSHDKLQQSLRQLQQPPKKRIKVEQFSVEQDIHPQKMQVQKNSKSSNNNNETLYAQNVGLKVQNSFLKMQIQQKQDEIEKLKEQLSQQDQIKTVSLQYQQLLKKFKKSEQQLSILKYQKSQKKPMLGYKSIAKNLYSVEELKNYYNKWEAMAQKILSRLITSLELDEQEQKISLTFEVISQKLVQSNSTYFDKVCSSYHIYDREKGTLRNLFFMLKTVRNIKQHYPKVPLQADTLVGYNILYFLLIILNKPQSKTIFENNLEELEKTLYQQKAGAYEMGWQTHQKVK